MSNKPFHYQDPFPLKEDDTEYYLVSDKHVSVAQFEGHDILKVEPEALTLLAQQAFHDASFLLRPAHQNKLPPFWMTRKPAKTINMSPCNSYVTLRFRLKGFYPPVKIPAPRSSWAKKASGSGLGVTMPKRYHVGSITPLLKITCAIHKRRAGYV